VPAAVLLRQEGPAKRSSPAAGPLSGADALDARDLVEARVEAQDPRDSLLLHHGDVQRVARREAR
jgi:hypothetical protein